MPGKKRGRGGKQIPERTHKKQKQAKPDKVPLPQDQPEQDVEIDEDDLGFVDEFQRNLGFLESLNAKQLNRQAQKGIAKGKAKVACAASDSDDGLEAEYERAPRQRLQEKEDEQKAILPTKSLRGELVYTKTKQGNSSMPDMQVPQVEGITVLEDENDNEPMQSSDADSATLESDSDAEEVQTPELAAGQKAKKAGGSTEAVAAEPQDDEQEELQQFENAQERREELKQQLAVTASKILQNPEAHLPSLKSVLALAADKDMQVSKLAMLSLLAVFKDILPGYRIRLPTEKELEIPVSKEVKQTRDYEAMQLRFYQTYLKLLLSKVGSKTKLESSGSQTRVAARCMCGLLSALHHFNYTTDLLQAVVPLMVSPDEQLRALSCEAIEDVLIHDVEGKVAVAAVQLVADLVKRRKCQCPPQLVDTLLVLKLKDAAPQGASKKGKKRGVKTKGKSKKSRRADEVEQNFKEAEATADRAEARITQSQMLTALFEIFFRVLKQCTQSGVQSQSQGYKMTAATAQRRLPLLMSSLHGLTKYAHLIDVEYFADLLQVMQHIMQMTALPLQQRLCCLLTASNILKGQGEALNIDRRDMYTRLYTCIPELAVLPLLPDNQGLKELVPPGAASEASTSQSGTVVGQNQPAAVLLLSVAQQMLLDQGKSLDTARVAAFTKQFSCTALHLETGAAMGSVALVNRLLRHNMKLRSLLEHEAGAPPPVWAASVGSTGGLADGDTALTGAPLWELALLHKHYHPSLAKAAAAVAVIPPQGGGGQQSNSGVLATAHEPDSLAASYGTNTGAFKPPPQPPRKTATPPKSAPLPAFAQLDPTQAEEQFMSQLRGSGMPGQPQTHANTADEYLAAVNQDSLSGLLQQWFKEQRNFDENARLRKQHGVLVWQLQQLRQHLAESQQKQKLSQKGRK